MEDFIQQAIANHMALRNDELIFVLVDSVQMGDAPTRSFGASFFSYHDEVYLDGDTFYECHMRVDYIPFENEKNKVILYTYYLDYETPH